MFKFVKSLFGNAASNKSYQRERDAYEKINSDYRTKYGLSYNIVYNYNDKIALYIARNEVSKYAVDWLAESIQKGADIEFSAVNFSLERGLPYICNNEEETWLFEKEEDPLKDSTEGIYSAILHYKCGVSADDNKINYWINRLLLLADNGNLMARGLLCYRGGMVLPDGKYSGFLEQNVWNQLKEKYESELLDACNAGNPCAQLSIAYYNRDITDDEKEKLYLSSIEKGLSDACYYYVRFLNVKRYVSSGYTTNMPQYGTDEWQEYMHDELSLYKKGAELNNGIMTGYCQFRLADMYDKGDGGVLKDAALAQIWYKKAYENGYKGAEMYLK